MFRQLEKLLSEQVSSGVLKPGDQVPSIAELCEQFDVSAITARRALTDLVQEGVLTSIQGKGTFVAVRRVPQQALGLTGVIFPDFTQTPFFASIHQGVDSVLGQQRLVIASSHMNPHEEAAILTDFMSRGITSVLFTPVTGVERSAADTTIRALLDTGLHLVAIDRGVANLPIDHVSSDNVEVGRVAARHCRDLGHQRIAFLWAHACVTFSDRQRGYEEVLHQDRLPIETSLERGGGSSSYEESGYFRTLELFHLAQPPTAIIAGNDLLALGVLRACRFLSIAVPGQVSVVSVDDAIAGLATPSLTAVRQPTAAMGRRAAEMVMQRAGGYQGAPRRELLPIELVVRESTGPVLL